MSGSEQAAPPNPGNIRADPDGPTPRPSITVDDALNEIRRRRPAAPAERPNGRATNGNGYAAREEAPQAEAPADEPWQGNAREAEEGGEREEQGEGYEGEGEPGAPESTFNVVIDGQQRSVPASELVAGYMRGADYSKKTQGLSQQQQQFAEAYRTFTDLREQLSAKLTRFTADTAKEFEQPIDWVKLSETDPLAWATKRARYDALKEAEAEQNRLQALRNQEADARKAEMVQTGHQILAKVIPGWKDAATRQRLQSELSNFAQQAGYSEQELAAGVLDPRHVAILHDAMLYRRMQQRRVLPDQPRQAATMDRGGSTPAPTATRREQEAKARFDANPSLDNALGLMKSRANRPPARTS